MKRRNTSWKHYNRSLIDRGRLTIWLSDDVFEFWFAPSSRAMGRPKVYSDAAMRAMLQLKMLFHMTYRQTQGLVLSLMQLSRTDLPVPCYTQMSRRLHKLSGSKKALGSTGVHRLSGARPREIAIDATGVKVAGQGEWLRRQHGGSKRRRWLKIHISLCPKTQTIITAEITDSNVSDCQVLPRLLKGESKRLKRVYADGAYDGKTCRKTIDAKGAEAVILPPKNAIRTRSEERWKKRRNDAVSEIKGLGGDELARSIWRRLKGYGRRALVETAFSRFKGIFGASLFSRKPENQRAEAISKLLILNKFIESEIYREALN